jgi:alkylhydroperoxidase family enzyme
VQPLQDGEGTPEQQELLERAGRDRPPLNIFRTLIHHPKLWRAWGRFGGHVLNDSTLPPREREILILRIGWLCQSEYEFGQHTRMGLDVGLSEAEIRRITEGPDAEGWDPFEATLLRAANELHADAFLSDATWAALGARYSTEQLMDAVFTVGQYTLVSMALNTLGVQREEGTAGFPA